MSGGSWDYAFRNFEEVAERLMDEKCALRRALGEHIMPIAKAMKAIEWVDSADCSSPEDTDAIKEVFGDEAKKKEMEVLMKDAREIVSKLESFWESENAYKRKG